VRRVGSDPAAFRPPNEASVRETHRRVLRYWDRRAADYAEQPAQKRHDGLWAAAYGEIFPSLPDGRGLDLLDVGTGTGFNALILARLGHRVTGVDLSPGMLGEARRRARDEGLAIEFLEGDAGRLPLEGERFDGVLARNLLWTLPDPAWAVAHWRDLLRPGGTMLVTDGRWNTPLRSLRRLVAALRPSGADRSGPRFELCYLFARANLPLYAGPSAAEAEELLSRAGLSRLERREGLFDVVPYEEPDCGFFVLTGRKPREASRGEPEGSAGTSDGAFS
jgi:SAM-dependent methyltransferase